MVESLLYYYGPAAMCSSECLRRSRTIAMLRSVSAQTGAEAACEQYDRVSDRLSAEHPPLRDLLDEGREEVLSCTN